MRFISGWLTPIFWMFYPVVMLIFGMAMTACGGGGGVEVGNGGQSSRAMSSILVVASSASSADSSLLSSVSSEISSSATSSGKNVVEIQWIAPNQRVNGDYMDISEIGGYELRYKRDTEELYTSIVIKDKNAVTHYLNVFRGEYEFKIAAFDIDGLYSEFVDVEPM